MFDTTELTRGTVYKYRGNDLVYVREETLSANRNGKKFLFRTKTGKEVEISQKLVQEHLWQEIPPISLSRLESFRGL